MQRSVTPLGTTSYSYSGLTTQVTAPNTTTVTVENALGETVSQTTNGKKVSYTYYASGAVKTATPEGGAPINMEYDLVGNRTKLTDPDAGVITTVYDAWGQLKSETQSIHIGKSPVVTNYTYSKGLLSKVDRQGEITNYDYDSNNRVSGIRMDGKHSQQFAYDRLDRVIKVVENIKNEKTYTTETVYDAFGRIKKEIYPDGYAVNNSYDSYGNLISVTDSYDNKIWQGLSANARGQLIKSKQGNTEKTQLYDSRGLPSSITAAGIIIMAYTFNDKGNLTSRSDLLTGHKEDFTYDTMNRLTAWDVSKSNVSQVNNSINYNPTTGTITTKSDVGFTFNYGEENGKPHALTSISGKPDRIPHSAQTITYTDFKKVKSISLGNKSLVLDYGVDEQRRKGVFKEGNVTFTRYYSGNYEEEISSSGKIKKIHYISGGDGLAGIYINDDGNSSFYSAYCDYQGSLLALTDINGVVKEKYAYDPWGNRRNPALWKDADTRTKFIIDRGYTLHEHLDALGLINMNGRVYDPLLGMFLSPDPYVQAPGNWLNYNRYGYCYGNPLLYTDPNGEIAWFIPVIIGAVIGAYTGASVQSGTAAFWKWDSDSWKGAIAGSFIGASIGGLFSSAIQATGMTTTVGNIKVASKAWGIASSTVNSASTNIGMNIFSGGGWDGAWRSGVVGAAMGAWSTTGGFGLIKSTINSKNIAKLSSKLAYQTLGTATQSIGDNWAMGRNPFSKIMLGVGPVNLTFGKGQNLFQWKNNLGNLAINSLGISNLAFGGKAKMNWANLAMVYTGGKMENMPGAWGPFAIMGPHNFTNECLSHEMHHVWQSRAVGDRFMLNYMVEGINAAILDRDIMLAIDSYNYYETIAEYYQWF